MFFIIKMVIGVMSGYLVSIGIVVGLIGNPVTYFLNKFKNIS